MPKYEWNKDEQRSQIVPGSYHYRSKWACFSCKKSFMRKRKESTPDVIICPDCKEVATDMGYLFQPPAKKDSRAWKIMEILGRNMFRFNKASAVSYIRYMITENNKLSPDEVQKNVERYLKSKT